MDTIVGEKDGFITELEVVPYVYDKVTWIDEQPLRWNSFR